MEVGQLVQPGQTLMSVVADTGIWITANMKETQLHDRASASRSRSRSTPTRARRSSGVVESIGSATGARFALLPPDNATGNFTKVVQRVPVRIVTRGLDAARPLRPGMSVVGSVLPALSAAAPRPRGRRPRTGDDRGRWLILLGLITAAIMEVLDTTIINVALPQMAGNLGATSTRSLGEHRRTSCPTSSCCR